ncbi:MAG: hypothetical protein GTN93_22245, partial [Anaerolineae bacterium]|nr:hypothetical protein [Anaerolineae bacterium]
MSPFPRTEIGGLSVSRMIVGTNWFVGCSHCTPSKDALINEVVHNRKRIADILEVFFRAGVDTVMGDIRHTRLLEAIKEAADRTGVQAIHIATPGFPVTPDTPANGFDPAAVERVLDAHVECGCAVVMPHQSTTDSMVDRCTRQIRQMDSVCRAIRDRGMVPGLSTHMPESIIYADETGLDVETYISLYNAMGFLMHLEVDWVASIIKQAKKPVITIKPMAAGQLRPFQALNFVWNTLRPI